MTSDQSNIIEELTSFFTNEAKTLSIELAYLFGSRADGKDGPISDYDIAVLFYKPHPIKLRYELTHKLAKILMAYRVDLVVLNHAPIELRYAVIASGVAVYEISFAVRIEYEALTLSRYGDFLPILRRQRQEILKDDINETGIQRYRAALGKLSTCLQKLEPFKAKKEEEILQDPYMQDIIERNLEVSAQAAIDIANRIISIEGLEKPRDYFEAILRLGEADVLP